jgi:hypothetical protein
MQSLIDSFVSILFLAFASFVLVLILLIERVHVDPFQVRDLISIQNLAFLQNLRLRLLGLGLDTVIWNHIKLRIFHQLLALFLLLNALLML